MTGRRFYVSGSLWVTKKEKIEKIRVIGFVDCGQKDLMDFHMSFRYMER